MIQWVRTWWKRVTGRAGRLLVIEPQADAMRLLRAHLRPTGFRIWRVDSAHAALRYFVADGREPHAVVVSMRQDDLSASGMEAVIQLAGERALSRSPLLVLHDPMGEEHLARCRHHLPQAEFIQRPYLGPHVRRRVRQAVRRGQGSPAARSSIRNSAKILPPPPRVRSRQ